MSPAMKFKVIKSEAEYHEALARIEYLEDALPGTEESDEYDLLFLLIENYEKQHYFTDLPGNDPIDTLLYYMEYRGLKQKDLIEVIGDKALVSKVLHRKRKLTLEMIRRIHEEFKIPYERLIDNYEFCV